MQELDLLGGQVGNFLNAMRELIVGLQIGDLLRNVTLNRLLDGSIEKLGVRGRIEVPVIVAGVVQHLDVAFDNPVWPTSMLTFGPPLFR